MMYQVSNFQLEELVCKHVFEKYGVTAWQFFDDRALKMLDFVRERLNKPITVNNWHWGGSFSQRGFRCTGCQLIIDAVKDSRIYCTPHSRGQAFDFDVEGLTGSEVRLWLVKNSEILPFPIRLESSVSWTHLDTVDSDHDKVYIFKP